jgi:hypothetical protein
MYIHESVKNDLFVNDKKLQLLHNGIITIGQFVSLIDINDPYTLIGPAIVAKNKINEFLEEWKSSSINVKTLEDSFINSVSSDTIIEHLDEISMVFPELISEIIEFRNQFKDASCPTCKKNKFLLDLVNKIKFHMQDGRDLGDLEEFIQNIIKTYFPDNNKLVNLNNAHEFDITWIKPEKFISLGTDLIDGLVSCFDCCKKHISRAKVLYEEWHLGYPDHGTLMYNEFVEANKVIEEGLVLYWDSLAQLDMASCELVGYNIEHLDKTFNIEILELANKIRSARILFQENTTNVPDWNYLRVEVQKIQNKISHLSLN